ncbi:TetR/AcrR family transcriptional regulator [Nocardiopsis lambiniae]|uniref:TetR/AcrR family transcriptional regulator C-terminal domain-containing protein n=1 Tax=Nocardiopsis lambiniae TaxID=3075539 RepID=A0ABU2M3W4_9ACTN|nr:TetR/AcrR family transcriptional regulator C-terminal domain-containing protein [Nocardiopsis sp. DSM 44743]MDT0326996.1 TetR/AcrR family transcriptional regulator C-terminal domain-containing protein [Nocardiopsis sp. DSM 44743]
MSETAQGRGSRRPEALDRDRVLASAVALADTDGLGAVTMRSLAQALGVKPMSLYHYVRGKEDLLDGMVDLVFGQIDLPEVDKPWRTEIRRRAVSARTVLARHPWALALMDTRTTPGPGTLRHHDSVVGVLMNNGFSPAMTERAYVIIDAYVYGFVLQEASLPFDDQGDAAQAVASAMAGFDGGLYPHLAAFANGHLMRADYAFGEQFGPGLDLVLDMVGALADP